MHNLSNSTLFVDHHKNDIEPFLVSRNIFISFLYEKLKEGVVSLLQRVAQPVVLNNSIRNLIKRYYSLNANVLLASSVSIGFGPANTLKLKSTVPV